MHNDPLTSTTLFKKFSDDDFIIIDAGSYYVAQACLRPKFPLSRLANVKVIGMGHRACCSILQFYSRNSVLT